MARIKTVKIKTGVSYAVINADEFDENKHELLVGEDEMVVKPKGVEDVKPFVIGKADFDENAYEKVNLTNSVAEEVAEQTDRQTLRQATEGKSSNSLEDEGAKSPQKTLKENQKRNK